MDSRLTEEDMLRVLCMLVLHLGREYLAQSVLWFSAAAPVAKMLKYAELLRLLYALLRVKGKAAVA